MDIETVARAWGAGFLVTFLALASFSVGSRLYVSYYEGSLILASAFVLPSTLIVIVNAVTRGVGRKLKCLVLSKRLDLFAGAVVGAVSALPVMNWEKVQLALDHVGESFAAAIVAISSIAMGAAVARLASVAKVDESPGLTFLSDDEIHDPALDALNVAGNARNFAEKVAIEGSRGSIVFGVDGAWGIGKSSFINLAQGVWSTKDNIIVFRFEPLKFGGEKDLVRAFVRELSGVIRSDFFAPELRPLASRYARMIKADPSVSVLGLKISANEGGSTIDEIIDDVDNVLMRIKRRVVVVIDDLDRVESDMVNRVLFMVRRSMKAKNIAYVLVYDAERMIANTGSESTREYFEKFVNASISLFVDLNDLANYLQDGWKSSLPSTHSSESGVVLALQSILTQVADLLASDQGGAYIGLVGNLRKIKRMINALLMMDMGSFEHDHTGFDRRDLVHLLLLYLNYPGVFREIYAHEGENRTGIFSMRPIMGAGKSGYENHKDLKAYLGGIGPDSRYLVAELFEVDRRGLSGVTPSREQVDTLACFNSFGRRNLAAYLEFIVRSVVPDPLQSEALFKKLLAKVESGLEISSALDDGHLSGNQAAQAKFWGTLAASARTLDRSIVCSAIDTIVARLPTYSYENLAGLSPRSSVVYSLAIIINSGFGDVVLGDPEQASQIMRLREIILGDEEDGGILRTLSSSDRGVAGMHDMLLFRLLCCADRGNQLRNIHMALAPDHLRNQSPSTRNAVVVEAVRGPSQLAFRLFRGAYIDQGINFMVHGDGDVAVDPNTQETVVSDFSGRGFIIYQLANALPPTGSGVGCGYFDESGERDGHDISRVMNCYLFERCFAPTTEENMLAFADYCLAKFSKDYFDDLGSVPTKSSLEQGLDPQMFRAFWNTHGATYKSAELDKLNRKIVTANYSATYSADLRKVWEELDKKEPGEPAGEESPTGPNDVLE